MISHAGSGSSYEGLPVMNGVLVSPPGHVRSTKIFFFFRKPRFLLALRPGLGLFFPEMQLHTFWMMMTVATQRALVVLFRFLIKVNQAMTHVLLAGMNCVPAISLLPAVNRTTAPSCEVVVQDQYFSLANEHQFRQQSVSE